MAERTVEQVMEELRAADKAGDKAKVQELLAEKDERILKALREAPEGSIQAIMCQRMDRE